MLKGKNVIVTGAAKGIGKAIALAFAKEGCNIVLNYHSHLDEETVKEIEDYGVICKPVQGDVSDFAFAADTPDTTYHIEFRYGYTEYKINSFYDGDYAYWMASGIKTDASEDVISDCVELFCSENLAE